MNDKVTAQATSLKTDLAHPSGLSDDDYFEDLSGTARNILEAAWDIVINEGFAALSFARIAELSGENRGSITYHFGSKEGLILALIDAFVHNANRAVVERTVNLPPGSPERQDALFDTQQRIAISRQYVVGFAELFPATLRNPDMLASMAKLYEGYRENVAQALGAIVSPQERENNALSHLIVAMVDGLSIQYTIDGDNAGLDEAIQLMNRLVQQHLEQLLEKQAESPVPPESLSD
ncbi:MAG: TetR/AcrR family transcriptional regulator [Actinomycetes bacterium]|nr:TetR/AcrR family transcriptional regulator [Actinomycetes bacterium]